MWYIYTREIYSEVQNNDILKFVGKWMELKKKIILSEITQIQKDNNGMYSLISGYRCKATDNQATIHSPREAR